jgi:methionyl aminopeptidase
MCRALKEGDVVNIDVTVYLNGYHGDTSRTFHVGSASSRAKRLVEANEEALQEAIKVRGLTTSATVCACKPEESEASFKGVTQHGAAWLARLALQICGPGVPLAKIGDVCQAVAQKHKLTVVRDFIGHGVGTVFHAAPEVMHNKNNNPGTMQVGTVL